MSTENNINDAIRAAARRGNPPATETPEPARKHDPGHHLINTVIRVAAGHGESTDLDEAIRLANETGKEL